MKKKIVCIYWVGKKITEFVGQIVKKIFCLLKEKKICLDN